MAISAGVDTHELDELSRQMLRTAEEKYPSEVKKFLTKQANKGRRVLRAEVKARTTKRTGDLIKGIDKGKVHKHNGDWQVRIFNRDHKAGPVEHGHVLVAWGNRTEKFVPGRHPAAAATKVLKAEFPEETEKFLDDLLREGFEL